jgi:pimeloyl-ACP methyl ester carboxylesterase
MNKTQIKPSLIILPGWGGNDMLWQHQVHHLNDIANVSVLAVANRDTIDQMAEEVLKKSETNLILVGHSIGGWIAQYLAIHFPERISKLILVSTWTGLSNLELVHFFTKALKQLKSNQRDELLDEVRQNLIYQQHKEGEELLQLVKTSQAQFPTEGLINQTLAEMNSQDTVASLHQIQCPTLLVYGRQDPFFTLGEQEAIKATIPHAKLALIEECGHLPSIERPQALTALIRLWVV